MNEIQLPKSGDAIRVNGRDRVVTIVKIYATFADIYLASHPDDSQRCTRIEIV